MEQARRSVQSTQSNSSPQTKEKSFKELFTTEELLYYGAAMVVYIVLGLIFKDKVLNVGVGPLFFVVWIWIVPPLFKRVRQRLSGE